MNMLRRSLAFAIVAQLTWFGAASALAAASPEMVVQAWYGVVLKLVRHTPTYTPPVAARSYGYLGIAAYEAVASGTDDLNSLAGQLNGLAAGPERQPGQTYDEAVVLQAALAATVKDLFSNTGPTGQRVIAAVEAKLDAEVQSGVPAEVAARSASFGASVAAHILAWSRNDGGATIENMGFPLAYDLTPGKAHWVPTSLVALQQDPLLPAWGKNRTFAMPDGSSCPLPEPPAYSEDPTSEFHRQALEVHDTRNSLSAEQRDIARFWADDAMLSVTPPGHWISIALQILDRDKAGLGRRADVLARLGIGLSDAFVGCWNAKYQYDLLRPVTYIRRLIDPKWEPLLTTPPFPEYPSGHSTQSAAAATVLTQLFGEDFAFRDATPVRDGMKPRDFASFWAAAEEAGISRLYGGIHFRAAIERGLEQGRCVGAHVNALRTRR